MLPLLPAPFRDALILASPSATTGRTMRRREGKSVLSINGIASTGQYQTTAYRPTLGQGVLNATVTITNPP